jgi:hypothetical protein
VAALEAERGPDASRAQGALHVVCGQAPGQLGVARDHLARDVDLLELEARVVLVLRLPGRVDGPELAAHVARLEAREVGGARRVPSDVVGGDVAGGLLVLADGPGQVVVAVDHGMGGEHAQGARHGGIVGGHGRGRDQQNEGDEDAADHQAS